MAGIVWDRVKRGATRWTATCPSKVNMPRAITSKSLMWCKFGYVTLESPNKRNPRTPPCGYAEQAHVA